MPISAPRFTGIHPKSFVDVSITGAVNGMSAFHVSCSDVDMNGSDDCGLAAGDAKGLTGRINDWIFVGMKGGAGQFTCDVPNSGVIHSTPNQGTTANVQAVSNPTAGDHWLWWSLKNFGTGIGTSTKVTVGWPTVSGKLKKVKLDGDVFSDPPDISPDKSPATITTFDPDEKKRQIAPAQTRLFAVEFEKNSSVDKPGDYTIFIEFDNGAKVISWDGTKVIYQP